MNRPKDFFKNQAIGINPGLHHLTTDRPNDIYGYPVIGVKPGLHDLSAKQFLLLTKLAGSKLIADNLVASAKSVEKLRVNLCDVHLCWRTITDHERNMAYRLLRIGQSMGFTCSDCIRGVLEFKGPEGSQVFIYVDLQELPRHTQMTHITCESPDDENPRVVVVDVNKDESVLVRFVELCEGILEK